MTGTDRVSVIVRPRSPLIEPARRAFVRSRPAYKVFLLSYRQASAMPIALSRFAPRSAAWRSPFARRSGRRSRNAAFRPGERRRLQRRRSQGRRRRLAGQVRARPQPRVACRSPRARRSGRRWRRRTARCCSAPATRASCSAFRAAKSACSPRPRRWSSPRSRRPGAARVVLGTLPDGKVMKYERGKLSDLATLKGAEHVWQVAFDGRPTPFSPRPDPRASSSASPRTGRRRSTSTPKSST